MMRSYWEQALILVNKDETPRSPVERECFSESLIPATVRDYNADFAMFNGIQPSTIFGLVSQPYTIPSRVPDLIESNVL